MKSSTKFKDEKSELINEIKEELIFYFKEGYINSNYMFEIDNVIFNNIEDILKIHFLLTDEVSDYIMNLEKNIRGLKNSTSLESQLFRGEVRGCVDWNRTITYRANTLYTDKTNFICDNVNKLFNTKENIILKKAISIIYNIIHTELGMDRFNNKEWYKNGEKFSRIISSIYKSNVYIKKIDITNTKITDKMIKDVSLSRNKLYRKSARILKLYNDILSKKEEHINDLFSKTFIELNDINTVFEFYCIFKYIRNKFNKKNIQFNIIDEREAYLAKLEDSEYTYEIYHNRTGNKYLMFNIKIDEIRGINNIHINKKLNSLDRKAEIHKELELESPSSNYWSGRPDLLIIKLNKETKELVEVEIGEVKYTDKKTYMSQGLEELLEYIYLLRDAEGNYIKDINIKGILFVNDIEFKKYFLSDIKIINRRQLNEKYI